MKLRGFLKHSSDFIWLRPHFLFSEFLLIGFFHKSVFYFCPPKTESTYVRYLLWQRGPDLSSSSSPKASPGNECRPPIDAIDIFPVFSSKSQSFDVQCVFALRRKLLTLTITPPKWCWSVLMTLTWEPPCAGDWNIDTIGSSVVSKL